MHKNPTTVIQKLQNDIEEKSNQLKYYEKCAIDFKEELKNLIMIYDEALADKKLIDTLTKNARL